LVCEQRIRGAPHGPRAADVLRKTPLLVQRDALGLADQLDARDVPQCGLRADALGECVGKTHLAIALGLAAAGRRYEHGAIILTANKSYGEWAESYRRKDRRKAGLVTLLAAR
jgi:hypothetical protein